jgi:cytochrome b involved in lipid metabolism
MLEQAGVDATAAFDEIGHSPDAHQLLEKLCIGTLAVSHDENIHRSYKKDAGNTASDAKKPAQSAAKPKVVAHSNSKKASSR